MSYSIYIGEAYIESEIDKENDVFDCSWEVKHMSLKDAPSFEGDDLSDKNNGRHPGYSQWSNFCREVGLEDVFFNKETGLMREHPGCFHLKKKHLRKFKSALKLREKSDKRPAGLDRRYIENEFASVPEGEETTDYNKVRLIWLIWWTEWALKNCKNPAIYNS